jgi:hypothetical protein
MNARRTPTEVTRKARKIRGAERPVSEVNFLIMMLGIVGDEGTARECRWDGRNFVPETRIGCLTGRLASPAALGLALKFYPLLFLRSCLPDSP